MTDSSSNIRFHPFKHISIRVPWHDNLWNGCVCQNPKENSSCLILKSIREKRDDEKESNLAGKELNDLKAAEHPICINERATFMAPFEIYRKIYHPYIETSEHHSHIEPMSFRNPIYSATPIPFRWMSKKSAWEIADFYSLDVNEDKEPKYPYWLRNTNWIQGHENQKTLLSRFFGMLEPDKSLCFFYAKLTPLTEDERRVIIGVGRVKHIGELIEYNYSSQEQIRAYVWDRVIQHSIRPDFSDGFLLPYHQILELAESNSTINIEEYVAFAPEDRPVEFSYASEHVTHDAAIASLLSCRTAIEKSKEIVNGPWDHVLRWIDTRLSELWKLRGPYPGLGVALTAFGFAHGSFLGYEIESNLQEHEDPWKFVDKVFKDPTILPSISHLITKDLQGKWKYVSITKPDRLSLLKLVSRMELTVDQAKRFYVQEERRKNRINCTDEELIKNPYLLFEKDLDSPDPISIWTVDRGIFPTRPVREAHPLQQPSALSGSTDIRRVRALLVNTLEQAASKGHTLMSRDDLVLFIRNLKIEPSCPIDGDLLESKDFSPVLIKCYLNDGSPAYQLERLATIGDIIRSTVEKRMKARRCSVDIDWNRQLNEEFGELKDEDEVKARNEKAHALKELVESRISVLIGPAGTGKTTLLSILCKQEQIIDGGILLLAPTGKARVRLQQTTKHPAQTLAQFLLSKDRYNAETGKYRLSNQEKMDHGRTVIIDEASMLTEEQLSSLFDALKSVDRYILVGDPCQLPPIGSGRPFVDIINHLKPPNIESLPIRVGAGYAELIIKRRQKGTNREDLQLAEWFSDRTLGPGEDEVLNHVKIFDVTSNIRLVSWIDAEDLRIKLLQALVDELKLEGINDQKGFDKSFGGNESGSYVYFNLGSGASAENWQITSPVKGLPHGVRELNRLIQTTFRKDTKKLANRDKYRKIPKPMGSEEILYGDKVINTINNWREGYPKETSLNYVANGEIGIAVEPFIKKSEYINGDFKKINSKLKRLKIEFSSQQGYRYSYSTKDFKEEGSSILELAYAITVHKSQGSEFNLSLFVLPSSCRILSRELLYTALTRQRNKVVLLHQGEISEMFKYSSDYYSETFQRMTNLFNPPAPRLIRDRFLEENLINISSKGEPMRSKSEVIIADLLTDAKIEYDYEKPLIGTDGQIRYPDFTIEDYDSGITFYWEHCGMLRDKEYRERWERKLAWYREQNILPLEEGGGIAGTLIVTVDTLEGGINAKEIKELIAELQR